MSANVVRGYNLPQELIDRLNEEAESQRRSASNMLVMILEDYFSRRNTQPHKPAANGKQKVAA